MERVTVKPAFGRDYRTNDQARKDWNAGVLFETLDRFQFRTIRKGDSRNACEIWCLHNLNRTKSRLEP